MPHPLPEDQFDLQGKTKTTLCKLFHENYELNKREYAMIEVEVPLSYNLHGEKKVNEPNNTKLARDAVFHYVKSGGNQVVLLPGVITCVYDILMGKYEIEPSDVCLVRKWTQL